MVRSTNAFPDFSSGRPYNYARSPTPLIAKNMNIAARGVCGAGVCYLPNRRSRRRDALMTSIMQNGKIRNPVLQFCIILRELVLIRRKSPPKEAFLHHLSKVKKARPRHKRLWNDSIERKQRQRQTYPSKVNGTRERSQETKASQEVGISIIVAGNNTSPEPRVGNAFFRSTILLLRLQLLQHQ